MMRLIFCVIFIYLTCATRGLASLQNDICGNDTQKIRSCTTQILGDPNAPVDKCQIEYYKSEDQKCRFMDFGLITPNTKIGGVSLKPHILSKHQGNKNNQDLAGLNITFSNIKWKSMKFRFSHADRTRVNITHCRDIIISNDVKVDDRSILYYDCFWSFTDDKETGQNHILDFHATDGYTVNRGKYLFKIPSVRMLSPTITEEEWQPFVYIEVLTQTMNLHIVPPPERLNITGYEVKVMKQVGKGTEVQQVKVIKLINKTAEVLHEYSLLYEGNYYFVVTPQHAKCTGDVKERCQFIISPYIDIIGNPGGDLKVCIASVIALVVGSLFASYIALLLIRRRWCSDYRGNAIPPPTKVMVVYSSANREHAQCVAAFVAVLREDYYFEVMYDADIYATTHKDPAKWADEAFSQATHIMYIAGPHDEANAYNKIYNLLLSYVRLNTIEKYNKKVVNVFFEYSEKVLPIETKISKEKYEIPRDWHKLIASLSKNALPIQHIMRTEKGKFFLANLEKAKEMKSSLRCDSVFVKSEKAVPEKKVLI